MINWLKKRSKEPSTFIGLALLIQAIGVLVKADGVDMLAGAVTEAAQPLASGDYIGAASIGLGGLMGVLMREKSQD